MRAQLYDILELLLVKNNIRLHAEELKLQVSSHPSYPSLHAVTGVLEHFNIPNIAIDLPTTLEVLSELPDHFIAYITEKGRGKLVLVEQVNNQIKITYEYGSSQQISKDEFLKFWNGIIVAIEKNEQIIEVSTSPMKQALKWFLISLSIFSIGYIAVGLNELFPISHFLLSIVGLLLSVLIVRHDFGMVSSIVNKFCNMSSASSCEATLSSKGAKLFNQFKLSDICLVTFSAYLLYWLLFFKNDQFGYGAIVIPTLFAIPITFYSIYYQFRVVEKWCPLCLGIAAVLWMQAGALFAFETLSTIVSIDWFSIFILLISGIISIGIWSFLQPQLERKLQLENLEVEHLKFKREFSIFNTLLRNEKSLNLPATPIPGEIILGNKNAPIELIQVTSPLCFYCKEAHRDLMNVLQASKNKVKVVIRFAVNVEDKESDFYKITAGLLHIYNTQNPESIKIALEEVFDEDANHKKWLSTIEHPSNGLYDPILHQQFDWCKKNQINFTPALILLGKKFPDEYNRTDINYFVDDLIEENNKNEIINSELIIAN